jgi:uncharacterized protein YpuA (DUF1002 family)
MRGKRKLALIGLAAVLGLAALGFGVNTALVAASDNTTDQDSTTAVVSTLDNETSQEDIFASKLADKLGLDEETVATAIKEVRQEMREEALAERLQEAVDEGTITQDEADQILAWMKNRPEALDELGGFGLILEGGPEMGHHGHGPE